MPQIPFSGSDCEPKKPGRQGKPQPTPEFSIEEHLQVQMEIERRAYQLWQEEKVGGQPIENWLNAETEVVFRFVETYPTACMKIAPERE